jgi:hypothetical protein
MTPKMADGFSAHFCRMGAAKATVLPEPVLLPPMQSLPLSSMGLLSLCMAGGRVMAMLASACTRHGRRPSDSKVVLASRGAVTWEPGSGSARLGRGASTLFPAWGLRVMRDGTLKADLTIFGSSSSLSVGDVRRRFLGLALSRESESESESGSEPKAAPSLPDTDTDAAEPASESASESETFIRSTTSPLGLPFVAADGMASLTGPLDDGTLPVTSAMSRQPLRRLLCVLIASVVESRKFWSRIHEKRVEIAWQRITM